MLERCRKHGARQTKQTGQVVLVGGERFAQPAGTLCQSPDSRLRQEPAIEPRGDSRSQQRPDHQPYQARQAVEQCGLLLSKGRIGQIEQADVATPMIEPPGRVSLSLRSCVGSHGRLAASTPVFCFRPFSMRRIGQKTSAHNTAISAARMARNEPMRERPAPGPK